uniref:SSS family, major sodium/proline symporter n=1 Tax=Neisseria meningitidis alpha275 TaxID=295996 RepID=C6SKZ8_NEIME|nr:SSS family, major sodium/proline symporter [Neisseria meningitidis alpha275]
MGGMGKKNRLKQQAKAASRRCTKSSPGFIVCLIIAVLVSLFNKEPSREIQERFEKADADYRAAR